MRVPGNESTWECSWEQKYVGTKVPVTFLLNTYFFKSNLLRTAALPGCFRSDWNR